MRLPTSITWGERLSQRGQPVLRVRFSVRDCRPCSLREACINSPTGKVRELRLRHHDEHHAPQTATCVPHNSAGLEVPMR